MFRSISIILSIALALSGCSSKKKSKSEKPKVAADSEYAQDGWSKKSNKMFDPGVYDQSDEIDDANGNYLLLDRVYFGFDRYDLVKQGSEVLEKYAYALRTANTEDKKIVIDGHTDERGTAEYNIALGQRRANTVHQMLKKLGVKIPMETRSYGKFRPAAEGHNPEAWKKNRRAEFHLVGQDEERDETQSWKKNK